eukprot:TRINITY_DN1725_c0_g2_i1.p1 TRINITY_DN1725_c0_g2~~TRINITY_DN1725_c0_g2_i1.p1  ORF type:complete len:491 (-),score=88.68 TRINITY_DN1725_c0_g2_i1:1315-2787(-)
MHKKLSDVQKTPINDTWLGNVNTVMQDSHPKNLFLRALDDAEDQYGLGSEVSIENKQSIIRKVSQKISSIRKQIINSNDPHNTKALMDQVKILEKEHLILIQELERMMLRKTGAIPNPSQDLYDFKLDSDVKYWSDYMKYTLHPKTIFPCTFNSNHDCPTNIWSSGSNPDDIEEIFDRFRIFSEDCNYCEGIQVFSDVDTCFGNVSHNLLLDIKSEFSRIPVHLYAFYGPVSKNDQTYNTRRIINLALSMILMKENSSIYVPLSYKDWSISDFPGINMNKKNKYQSSSIFASAINDLNLQNLQGSSNFNDISNSVAQTQYINICALETCLPWNLDLFNRSLPLQAMENIYALTPNLYREEHVKPYGSFSVFRGIDPNNPRKESELRDYLNSMQFPSRSYISYTPSFVPISFPRYFNDTGYVHKNEVSNVVEQIGTCTHLQSTPQQTNNIGALIHAIEQIPLDKLVEYSNLEPLEAKEIVNILENYRENYI